MPTTDATASGGTAANPERTIALMPEQAALVASLLLEETGFAITRIAGNGLDVDITRREQFDAIRTTLADSEAALDQINWGTPQCGATLTLPKADLYKLANRLMYEGTLDSPGYDADAAAFNGRERREKLRTAEAGIAIVDQLEATR